MGPAPAEREGEPRIQAGKPKLLLPGIDGGGGAAAGIPGGMDVPDRLIGMA